MGVEDEIQDRFCLIIFDYLDEKDARDIRKLIQKARSAPMKSRAMWYLDWADSLVEKARNKVDEFSCFNPIKSS